MIHPSAVVGPNVKVGVGVVIGAGASIEGTVSIGDRCEIAAGARIGAPGFGFTLTADGSWMAKPHPFGVELGADTVIGANTVICRGSWRNTVIGDGTKVDGAVFIAHNVHVHERCLVIARAEISGSVSVGSGSIIGPGVTVKERLSVGARCLIGIGSVVLCDVPDGEVWAGVPARYLRARRAGEAV